MSASLIRPDRIRVLLADSTAMRSQLLSSALRRRPELKVTVCAMSSDNILKPLESGPIDLVLFNSDHRDGVNRDLSILRRVHLSRPDIHKILIVDQYDRQLTINAFRSGVHGLFSFSESKFRDLCKCIHVVHNGQVWANTPQLHHLLELVHTRAVFAGGQP